jgi:DNA recombination protein RmuC
MAVGAGLIFGFLIAWISLRSDRANIYARGKSDAEKEKTSLEERILAKDNRIQELQQILQKDRDTVEGLRDENANLRATHAEYDSRVTEIRQQAEEKIALVNESQHRLVETLRGTLNEKSEELEARVRAIQTELEQVRQENESLRAVIAATPPPAPAGQPELLAEREMQLASVLEEALQMRKQIDTLEAERAALASTPAAELLAARERQLTQVLGEALHLRERVDALEAEKAHAIAPELLGEREGQLTVALAERDAARERVQTLEAQSAMAAAPELLAERETQLAAALAEAGIVRERLQSLEAEKAELAAAREAAQQRVEALEAEKAGAIAPELLAEREMQLAAALAEAGVVRERLQSLETEKAELAAAREAAQHQVEALEAEKASRQPTITDRIAMELLADREIQLKEARQRLDEAQAYNQSLQAEGRAHAERLEQQLVQVNEQVNKERLEAEALRAENANLEAAKLEAEAALTALQQRRVRRAPFSPVRARSVVEMAGLAIHSEFHDAEGNSFADTVTVRLPGTKRIQIHSLPDVVAYREALAATDEAEYAARTAELAAAIRSHLNSLASKGKELAVAYLPGDVLLGAALEQDPDLLECAAQRGVIVATPNSLVGLLSTASSSWRQHKISGELEEARAKNQDLFEELAALANSVDGLRSSLGNALSVFQPKPPAVVTAEAVAEQEQELIADR